MSDNLMTWFDESQSTFKSLEEIMISDFIERTKRLCEMPKKACDVFWWPFTRHKSVPEENVTVIDSRYGESFTIHKVRDFDWISQQFDACASWWTQGPDLNLQFAAEMLCCQPDISCFGKLMTSGIIPLDATLASDAVFETFTGDSKLLLFCMDIRILHMRWDVWLLLSP